MTARLFSENGRRHLTRLALGLLMIMPNLTARATEPSPPSGNVRFVAIGDLPYGENKGATEYDNLRRLLKQPAEADRKPAFDFVLHFGDFQRGVSRCRDPETNTAAEFFKNKSNEIYGLSTRPVFFTPGDNDWTDCDRHLAGVFELDALASLRRSFFPPGRTAPENADWNYRSQGETVLFGKPYKAPENARWRVGNVLFATVHLVATRNGRAQIKKSRNAADIHKAVLNAAAREEAAYNWISETLKSADRTDGIGAVVIAMHVDPDRTNSYADYAGSCPRNSIASRVECEAYKPQSRVFEKLLRTINANVEAYAKDVNGRPIPVLLLHGDTGGTYLCRANDRDCINTNVEPCKTYTPKSNRILKADNLWRLNAMGDFQWDALIVDVTPSAAVPFRATRILEPNGDIGACK